MPVHGCSYAIDVNVDKVEDVLLHRRILNECANPDKRPVFHVRHLHVSILLYYWIVSQLDLKCATAS